MTPSPSKPRLYVENRGAKRYVYLKQTSRVKIDPNARGKTKGSGKSRVVTESEYLGTEQEIVKLLRKGGAYSSCIMFRRLGLVAAGWKVAEEYSFPRMINEAFGARERKGCVSLGEYLTIQAVLQITRRVSRNKLGEAYETSALKWLKPGCGRKLNSKNYWRVIKQWMGRKPRKTEKPGRHHKKCHEENKVVFAHEHISEFDIMLWNAAWEKENMENRDVVLYYDTTKLRVHHELDKGNEKVSPGYGSKQPLYTQKLGLALAISEGVPLHYMLYQAKLPDCKLFPEVVKEICKTIKRMREEVEEVILVYDKGNNSKANVAEVASQNEIRTWIMSARVGSNMELRDKPLKEYTELNEEERRNAGDATHLYETEYSLYGYDQKVAILYNPKTYRKKKARFEEKLEKARNALKEEWKKLNAKKEYSLKEKRAMMDVVLKETKVETSSASRYFSFGVSRDGMKSRVRVNRKAVEEQLRTFGKQLICSNRLSFDALEMASIYIHRDEIEKANHHLKDIKIVSVTPIWVWNDVQIEAHVFATFLSYFISRVIYRRVLRGGVTTSYETALAELESVREGINIYDYGRKDKRVQQIVTKLSPTQEAIFEALELRQFLTSRLPSLEFSVY